MQTNKRDANEVDIWRAKWVDTEEDPWVSGLGNEAALPLTKLGHQGKARTL